MHFGNVALDGNPITVEYGKTKPFENIPDQRVTVFTKSRPVTAAEIRMLIDSLRSGDSDTQLSLAEVTFDGKRQGKHTIDRFDPQWVCRFHYDRWNADRARFLADRLGCQRKNFEGARQVPLPHGRTLARQRELLAARFAHSHSGSQFLPHFPSHWYSDILPPHCGHTRLRIDERMRTFNSPGGASMVIMFEFSPDPARGRNGGRMTEVCCAGFVRL